MKKKEILSYILIPILLAIFILSIAYSYQVTYYGKYFEPLNSERNSANFIACFMEEIATYAHSLIYNTNLTNKLKDGDNTIFYADGYVGINCDKVKNMYVLISYKDKYITNVELTSDTNTVEGIQKFIEEKDSKHFKMENSYVESDTEELDKNAIQYYDSFEFDYYKVKSNESSSSNELVNSSEDEVVFEENGINYIRTQFSDFTVYANYEEELEISSYHQRTINNLKSIEPYSNLIYISIPISGILTVLLVLYLITSIGTDKNNKVVDLNKFDKIPYEIVFILGVILISIAFLPIIDIVEMDYSNIAQNLQYSILATCYLFNYIVTAILLHTTVKRIKLNSFTNTSIICRLVIWILKIFRNIAKKVFKSLQNTFKNIPRFKKLVLYFIVFFVVEIILLLILNSLGIVLDIALIVYVFIKIMQYINSYEIIEDRLKGMYEGEEDIKLDPEEVEPAFRDSVMYINDISNGFSSAINESMKSERLKTELITNVSHDIKTPLTSIINYVDLLKKEKIDNPKANEYIEVLDKKSQRLKKLIEDLVEASKASSGNIRMNIEKLNVVELIKQSLGEFEDKFKERNLDIQSDYSKSEIFIMADSRYLYRSIENMLSNISKYALENSRVYIEVFEEYGKVKISMKNISKEKLNITTDELMQRFVRGDKSRTTEGSGLGISIAKSLVEAQNGKFSLNIDGDLFKVEIEF
jgi:signal transduction histidine kinase